MSQLLEDKIKQIQEKMQLLIKQQAAVMRENQSLKNALEETKGEALTAIKRAESIQHQLDAKQYTQGLMNIDEKKIFEKKINSYIKEIEKCIALLSV